MFKAYLEPHEIERLENAATNLRDRLLIRLLFHLGCRISEALSLKVEDIDFMQGIVTIIHLKSRVKLSCSNCGVRLGLAHAFCPKCGSKVEITRSEIRENRRQRSLPIDTATLTLLKEYIERGGPVLREGKRPIFGINRHRAWQIIRQCAQKAGLGNLRNPETGKIRGVSPHRLRDAFAVHAMKTEWRPLQLLGQHHLRGLWCLV